MLHCFYIVLYVFVPLLMYFCSLLTIQKMAFCASVIADKNVRIKKIINLINEKFLFIIINMNLIKMND